MVCEGEGSECVVWEEKKTKSRGKKAKYNISFLLNGYATRKRTFNDRDESIRVCVCGQTEMGEEQVGINSWRFKHVKHSTTKSANKVPLKVESNLMCVCFANWFIKLLDFNYYEWNKSEIRKNPVHNKRVEERI